MLRGLHSCCSLSRSYTSCSHLCDLRSVLYIRRPSERQARSAAASQGMPHHMWLDCDPGHDDALALMLATAHPDINLVGVSTNACNASIEDTTANALATLHAIGADVPVYQGQGKPLLRPAPYCAQIHGSTGLDAPKGGRLFPNAPTHAQREEDGSHVKAVHAMAAAITQHYRQGVHNAGTAPLQLVCTGALTNAALLLALHPEIVEQSMVEVTIMGGAIGAGNTGPVSEFNIQTDPEAAKIVFDSGVPLTMVPLETTHTVLATDEIVGRVHGLDTPFATQVAKLLQFFAGSYREEFGFEHPPVHDPVAVAYIVAPHLFHTQRAKVSIETNSALAAGQTVVDARLKSRPAANTTVCLSVDSAAVWEMLLQAIQDCSARSSANLKTA